MCTPPFGLMSTLHVLDAIKRIIAMGFLQPVVWEPCGGGHVWGGGGGIRIDLAGLDATGLISVLIVLVVILLIVLLPIIIIVLVLYCTLAHTDNDQTTRQRRDMTTTTIDATTLSLFKYC